MNWHSMDVREVLERLGSSAYGLSEGEALRRLGTYGPNELVSRRVSPLRILARQFSNFLVITLLAAAAIAWALGEVLDASAIALIVAIMGVAGFMQEFRAERAVEALKSIVVPVAKVLRDGRVVEIPAHKLVPGDVILLAEGDRVPADARLLEADSLTVDESPLTGESVPVSKDAGAVLPPQTPLHSRVNMVFMGTYVLAGRGKAVVVATGMHTFLGSIAKSLSEVKGGRTLLEQELDRLGRKLGAVVLGISAFTFITSTYIAGMSPVDALLLSIALAVAAIPEGLPAVATSVLAVGAYRMSRRNVVVRELSAIEALGACDVIATDKTGTITKGEMTVRLAWIAGREYVVSGSGYDPSGTVSPADGGDLDENLKFVAELLLEHVAGDVRIVREGKAWRVRGSPTEGAALVFALKVLGRDAVTRVKPPVKTYPFDRFRKRKTTLHVREGKAVAVTSGAPEPLISASVAVLTSNGIRELGASGREALLEYVESLASRGYRTYALAIKELPLSMARKPPENPDIIERGLTLAAIFAIIDPPREGVKEAVREVRSAGVRVVIVTGDHRLTAKAIAEMIGLDVSGEGSVIEGSELDRLSDEELRSVVESAVVFARVTPEHKRRIVRALKANGHVVAMTGDGVNDAPALKEADIGVAMGVRGTDVAKEVAKLILKDDNFVSIVEAVREGRVIYENLKKPINYLLPANIGEVATIFAAELVGLPPPLTAPQLLWINVTTDSLPALALSMEPPEPDVMRRPPRRREGAFITNRKLTYFTLLGAAMGAVNLAIFKALLPALGVLASRTAVFAAMAFSEFGRALTSRSESRHFWSRPFNRWLLPALAASTTLQMLAIYAPRVSEFFTSVPLPPWVLAASLATAAPVLLIDEVRKALKIRL